ncbi:LysR family transcriptional regulator [Paracoccus sphaerophysae]|uniref:LysR family transcriptional regulator n=2 Tax=Paracoccus sphaerophysae TaxID=690417 RepID=A0A099ETJ9_9RHOB|nr:LysR family transcriptional regulator [Paracoccus sphaerophysae]
MPRPRREHLSRMTLRQMQLMTAIAENGSLKRASEAIEMSQPRATKSLREVEHLLGCTLFNRTNRGLFPNAAGDCAIRHARVMLAQLDAMEREIHSLSGAEFQRLRIGTIMGAVPYISEIITIFLQRFPHTSVEIIEDTSADMLRMLDRGQLDLMIGRSSVSPNPHLYNVQAFHDELLSVVANPLHPLVGRKRVTLQDLSDSRWIVYAAAMPMRLSLEQEYRRAGLAFPRNLLETRSALTTMALIQANANTIALLSSDVAAFFTNFSMARTLPMHLQSRSEPYEVITRQAMEPSEPVAIFIEDLVSGVRPQDH